LQVGDELVFAGHGVFVSAIIPHPSMICEAT
jgi:hypothetical protein